MAGKRKHVKKNNEAPSASASSSSSMRLNEAGHNQIQIHTKNKVAAKRTKRNEEEHSNSVDKSEGQGQQPMSKMSLVQKASIYDLPIEMVMEILNYVDTRTLFKCRLVSRQWCGISSGILTKRSPPVLSFINHETGEISLLHSGTRAKKKEKRSLKAFVYLMRTSENVPYAYFSFLVEDKSFFGHKFWSAFLSLFITSNSNPNPTQNVNQKTKLKGLSLDFSGLEDEKAVLLLEKELRSLLQNKLTHLEQFDLNVPENIESFSNPVSAPILIPNPIPAQFQLANLKVLRIQENTFNNFRGLLRDILEAAVNLEKIEAISSDQDFLVPLFQFLHSVEKLHAVKEADIKIDEEFLSAMKTSVEEAQRPLVFNLTRLNLCIKESPAENDFHSLTFCRDATNFLSNLFESSKNSLRELKMKPLGFLPELKLPKFKNLFELKLIRQETQRKGGQLFPPPAPFSCSFFPPGTGTESIDIFPAVKFLSFWPSNFLQEDLDSIPSFPCVKYWILHHSELSKKDRIAKIGRIFPNLQRCRILKDWSDSSNFNFPRVGQQIWAHMTKLRYLEVDIYVNSEKHAFPALDSCFTGISKKNCRRLQDLMNQGKIKRTLNVKTGTATLEAEIRDSKLMKRTKRKHPSILDLKELKTLVINQYTEENLMAETDFFTQKLSWISEEFAFKFLPHLEMRPKPKRKPAKAE